MATFQKIRPSSSKEKGKGKAVFDAKIQGHTDEVLALAMSDDGKYLVSAGRDRRLGVWDTEKGEWVKGLGGHLSHRDVISVCICIYPVQSCLGSFSPGIILPERDISTVYGFLRPHGQSLRLISECHGLCRDAIWTSRPHTCAGFITRRDVCHRRRQG